MLKDRSFLSKRNTNYSAGSLLSTRFLISLRLISGPQQRIQWWTRSGMTTRSIWLTSFNLNEIKFRSSSDSSVVDRLYRRCWIRILTLLLISLKLNPDPERIHLAIFTFTPICLEGSILYKMNGGHHYYVTTPTLYIGHLQPY